MEQRLSCLAQCKYGTLQERVLSLLTLTSWEWSNSGYKNIAPIIFIA